MDLAETAWEWLEIAKATKSLGPRTIEGYAYSVGLLVQDGVRQVDELTRDRVWAFLEHRRSLGAQPQTLNRNLAAVCSFASALERRGAFELELLLGLRRLRYRVPPLPPPFFVPLDRVAAVEAAARRVDEQLHRAVAIGFTAGLRAGELVGLRHEELHLRAEWPYLVVARDALRESKTYTARTVPLRRADALRLAELGLGGRQGPVFPAEKLNSSGMYLHPNTLGRRLAFARLLVDLGGKLDFLVLRHSFASHHVQRGVNLYKVSRWLGHRSIKTTEKHYAALAPGGDPDVEIGSSPPGGDPECEISGSRA